MKERGGVCHSTERALYDWQRVPEAYPVLGSEDGTPL